MHRHTRVVPLSVRDVFQPCSDRVRTYTTPGLRHRIMGRKVTSKLELKSVSEVLSDVRLDAGFQAAVETARYYIEKYRTQRNSSKISQIGQWFLTFKDDKSKSEEILDMVLSSSDAIFELGNYEKSIELAKEGYDLAQNVTEEARTRTARSLGRKCLKYGMSIHGSKPDAAARFLRESLNTILDQLSLLGRFASDLSEET
ncbi:hypothetical protein BKA69DRAFT_556927 [Paraphysoderma sedebokerense]|nr:hypothetical protein BKA69DRAFT_556927 [Paraphysoderma sedebokerense]